MLAFEVRFVCLYAYNDSRTAEEILIKFGIHVMPLEDTPMLYFKLHTVVNTYVDGRSCL